MDAKELQTLINAEFAKGLPKATYRKYFVALDKRDKSKTTRFAPCSSKVISNLGDLLSHICEVGIGKPPAAIEKTDKSVKHGSGIVGDVNKSLTLKARGIVQAQNGPEWNKSFACAETERFAFENDLEFYQKTQVFRMSKGITSAGILDRLYAYYNEHKEEIREWSENLNVEHEEETEDITTKADL